MPRQPAIAVLEFDSIAIGTHVADAMTKKAPLETFRVGTVHPGKYVVLIGGSVAAVEESYVEGLRIGADGLTDEVFLPNVHPQVYDAVGGKRLAVGGDALGVIEASGLAATVLAADKAVKSAEVAIVEIRLGDGLGGKGVTHFTGAVHDVQAAIEAGLAVVTRPNVTVRHTIIPVVDGELRRCIGRSTQFFTGSGG
ncbi:MAG: BMC domain-containing protein [Phycisphaerae bacterium]|nr:BMC domain-containing protein [Phycisphaerae bacterium]